MQSASVTTRYGTWSLQSKLLQRQTALAQEADVGFDVREDEAEHCKTDGYKEEASAGCGDLFNSGVFSLVYENHPVERLQVLMRRNGIERLRGGSTTQPGDSLHEGSFCRLEASPEASTHALL